MSGFFGEMAPDWERHWKGMPEYCQENLEPYQSIKIHFRSPEDREAFAKLIARKLTSKTKSVWFPQEEIGRYADKRFRSEERVDPKYPIYIVSKGRWKTRLTAKALEGMKIPYRIVVEKQERKKYARMIDPKKILVLPSRFQKEYDTCDDLGETKSKGPGAARNFCWEHSMGGGATWHWVMDDNIEQFMRLYRNIKTPVVCGNMFAAAESFVGRYENIAIAGFNYKMFVSRKTTPPPYCLNTRIYSCLLIRNDIPYRWRGRYNEDTDLSLCALKDGWCTVQFNAFIQSKLTTQTIGGGCTEEFYRHEGTLPKSKLLAKMHPDVATVVWKFGRWHHHVDYSRFKRNKLKPKHLLGIDVADVDNFGMYLEQDKVE